MKMDELLSLRNMSLYMEIVHTVVEKLNTIQQIQYHILQVMRLQMQNYMNKNLAHMKCFLVKIKEPKKKSYKPVGPMIDIMTNPDKKGQNIDIKV